MTAGTTRSETWIDAAEFLMGSDAHYPDEAPSRRRGGRRVLDRPLPGHQPPLRRLRGRDRLRHRRRAPARPGGVPGAPPENLVPGSLVFTRTRGPGRPAPHQPVVDLDAGRELATPRRDPAQRSPGARSIRSSTSPTRTRPRTPTGPAARCRPRRSGSSPRAAGSTAPPTCGATRPSRPAPGSPTTGTATSRGGRNRATGRPRRSAPSSPTASGSTTWPATSGSGRRTGTAAARPRAATRPSRSSRSRERSSGRIVPVRRQLLPALPPAARRPQMIDTGMSHVGFRCVRPAGHRVIAAAA